MNPLRNVSVALAVCSLSGTTPAQQLDRPSKPVIGVCLIPEHGFIPEVQTWSPYKGTLLSPEDMRTFGKAWKESWKDRVVPIITPEAVRQMVHPRDRHGMARYTRVTVAEDITWRPVTMYRKNNRRYVVLEGTIDKLPRIMAIRRWLSVYCLYDANNGTISRVTFTVNGDRDE